ncbi:hypothetical protein NL676_013164 [Syzygium grande]|nr:hypothetical protein NL676_013164 [Syzygium grande]
MELAEEAKKVRERRRKGGHRLLSGVEQRWEGARREVRRVRRWEWWVGREGERESGYTKGQWFEVICSNEAVKDNGGKR